jgi:sugar lactone lactonase YvrE
MFATQPERAPLNPTLRYKHADTPGRAETLRRIHFIAQYYRGRLVRQFRLLGVAALASAVVIAGLGSKSIATRVHAQNQFTPSQPVSSAVSSKNTPATIVAAGIATRSVAVQPIAPTASHVAATSSSTQSVLFLSSSDRPNMLFSFATSNSLTKIAAYVSATTPEFSGASLPTALAQLDLTAGTGITGSLGDGAKATAAQFDLSQDALASRSGIAVAPDGSFFIADTKNATIREVAGPDSTEPGIIRSVAGRFSSSQNVTLQEPLGLALDRAGNLYIADHSANTIAVLYGSSSPKAGQLESIANAKAPSTIAVTPDGRTLFVASADNGTVSRINLATNAVRDAGISPAALFPSALVKSSGVRIVPQGLATDGAGNLFVAYALTDSSTAASVAPNVDQILRLDAFTAKVTVAARSLNNPGDISFNAAGDLFVSNQNSRQILKFASMAVPGTGVTLTPPAGTGATTDFGPVPVGGATDASALESFELANNTTAALTNVAATIAGGNNGDFTINNSSCVSTLAANSACDFNLSFTPTQNATSACADPTSSEQRCANLSVNYVGAAAPLTAALTGTADNFDIQCVTTDAVVCVPNNAGGSVQITIPVGYSATYQFQIMPDAVFSGNVTVVCPTNLPATPAGTTAQPTQCGISAGTSVAEPLVSSLVIPVTAGTAAPFNVTFQTTTSSGKQFPPGGGTVTAQAKRALAFFDFGDDQYNKPGAPPSTLATPSSRFTAVQLTVLSLFALAALLLVGLSIRFASANPIRARRLAPVFGFAALLIVTVTIVGCHHYKNPSIAFTPAGTFNLTVNGSAQNTSRGYTMTLIVE